MANNLQKIVTYNQKYTLPSLRVGCTFISLANKKFQDWKEYQNGGKSGNRGDQIKYRLPTLFTVQNQIAVDTTNVPGFTERFGFITIDKEASIPYQMTDQELALYPLEELARDMGDNAMDSMANVIDQDLASTCAFGGFRWIGDVNASSSSMLTFPQLRSAMTQFRDFGGTVQAHAVLPPQAATAIANTGFQEFIPSRNDAMARDWELGQVNGVNKTKFYQSFLLPKHFSGTASQVSEIAITNVVSTTYTINGIARPASIISLSGLTPGATILANDLGQIGSPSSGSNKFNTVNPLKFLREVGQTLTNTNVQFKVISDAVAGSGGTCDITVIPSFIYDPTNQDPARNINRAIVPGTDVLQIVKSHQAGVIFLDGAFFYASPPLPNTSPYDSGVAMDESGLSLRTYQGFVIGQNQHLMVHDLIYGATMEPNYAARLIFPLDSNGN